VYQVVNQMPHSIYLGGKEFPRGERRPWFHGHQLQPTAETVLTLVLDDSGRPAGPATVGRGVVEEKAAPKTSSSKQRVQIAVIAVCLPLALIFFLAPNPAEEPGQASAESQAKVFDRLRTELGERGEREPAWQRINVTLAEARDLELRGRIEESYHQYSRVRLLVAAQLGHTVRPGEKPPTGSPEEVLQQTWEFANEHLIGLSKKSSRLLSGA
jgi:hypothetical protein